jgi:hypothetical protein
MLTIVASNNELAAKLSGDWLRSKTGFDLFALFRRLKMRVSSSENTDQTNLPFSYCAPL